MTTVTKKCNRSLTGFVSAGVIMLLTILIGTGLSGCGGDGDSPPDYKSLLKEASRYVADMEQKNAKLSAKLKEMTGRVGGEKDADTDEGAGVDDDAVNLISIENETLIQEKEALVAEIAALKAKEELTVTKKMASLEAKNKSLAGKKAVYEEEIAKLRKKVKANEGLAGNIKALEEANEKLTEHKDALEKEIADLRAELGKAEQLTQKLETLENENKALSDLNEAIESRMEEIQKIMSVNQKSKKSSKHK